MKLVVDRSRCEGHGLCEAVAPDLLRVDDGFATPVHDGDVPADQQDAAHSAVEMCPIAALRTA
ncbi:ferredoxin [Streptomyces purpureus]|uniref:Ferredoxin n=2 Tax=Streptomyces purpureus TaxID=1951 RepID=A0A918GXQ4_9ACTN|nr:ferredoxin [Streptomyces purpureus]GGT19234.1 ferredoxin [Streptomyces purpureus]